MGSKFLRFVRQTYIFALIALIYIPLITVIFLSFTKESAKDNVTVAFNWTSFENFYNLFHNSQFLNALANTAIIIAFVVPISTIIAVITCFGIWNARQVYQGAVLGASKVNIVIPDIITGISLALLFSVTWIAWFKASLGFATVIMAHISFCVPYAIMIIYPRMQKMNKNLIMASQDLGYSPVKTFFKITIPFLLPSIFAGSAIVFGMSFDDFIITSLVGGKVNTISTEMYTMARGIKMWAVTFGALMVLGTFLIVTIVILKRTVFNDFKKKRLAKKQVPAIARKDRYWLRQKI